MNSRSMLVKIANAAQRLLLPLGLRSSRRIGGKKIVFDPGTDIGMQLLVTGDFEATAIAECARHVRAGGYIVDIGANIGVHTVQFAGLTPTGKVISFEPARATFEYLLRNVAGIPNVIPLNIALSDSTGIQEFHVAADNAYSGLKDTRRKTIVRRESVACFRADEVLAPLLRGQRLDLVKIDVEGLELQVLTGLQAVIAEHRPVIFCEIFGGAHSNPDPAGTVAFCVSLGYDAFVISGERLVPAPVHDDRLYNYFFIPR